MVNLCWSGNFHSKPEMPFDQGLSLPPDAVLSVNQVWKSSSADTKSLAASRTTDPIQSDTVRSLSQQMCFKQ